MNSYVYHHGVIIFDNSELNDNSFNSLAGKIDSLKKISAFKCEMFLNVYQENLDLELDLEDTIHTIVNNDNPDHFNSCMTFRCELCGDDKNRNKVKNDAVLLNLIGPLLPMSSYPDILHKRDLQPH
jgi:hypothetical protein